MKKVAVRFVGIVKTKQHRSLRVYKSEERTVVYLTVQVNTETRPDHIAYALRSLLLEASEMLGEGPPLKALRRASRAAVRSRDWLKVRYGLLTFAQFSVVWWEAPELRKLVQGRFYALQSGDEVRGHFHRYDTLWSFIPSPGTEPPPLLGGQFASIEDVRAAIDQQFNQEEEHEQPKESDEQLGRRLAEGKGEDYTA